MKNVEENPLDVQIIRTKLSYTDRNLRSDRGQVVEIVKRVFGELDFIYYPEPLLIADTVNGMNRLFPQL